MAWHLAKEPEARSPGTGTDVIDKTGVSGGASVIACGAGRGACTR